MSSVPAPWQLDGIVAAALHDRAVRATWPACGGALPLAVAAVAHPARFDAAWFARHAVDCPPRIARAVPKRQAEYFAGRLCARAALAAQGLPPVQIGTGALSAPAWPAGWKGSITHTHALAMAAVLPAEACRGIGIDLEIVPDADGLAALYDIALNPAERALVGASGSADPGLLATLIFSAKESFFKATAAHVGRYFDFSAIECVAIQRDVLTCIVRESLTPELAPGLRCDFDVAWGGQHVLTCLRW